jgi:gliding motility-associated-like protein
MNFIKTIFIFVALFVSDSIFAQNQGAIWYFGNNAGLDFNTNPPTILTNGQVSTSEGSAVICDAAGGLLFYTDGSTVWGKNHVIMPSQPGGGLGGNSSSTQSGIIIPKPGTLNNYYVFSTPATGGGPFQWAEVDMTLNGGNGDLVSWNNVLHAITTEKLTAIGDCGGTEFWVMSHPYDTDTFYAYKVNSTGILPPVKSKIGLVCNNAQGLGLGYIKFTSNGTKMASANYTGYDKIELFDFDMSTGILSNYISDPLIDGYGASFSPDGTKLYCSNSSNIYQYDVTLGTAAAIIASKFTVGSSTYGALQNAINGKMYHSTFNNSIDVIEFPNLAGAACNLIVGGQSIAPATGVFGLPAIIENYLSGNGGPILKLKYPNCNYLDSTSFASSVNTAGATYLWNFGDPASGLNDTSTLSNPTHIFSANGTYVVTLIVNSVCGNDTVIKNITVSPAPNLIPMLNDTICNNGVYPLTLVNTVVGNFSYTWAPSSYLDNPNIQNPTISDPGIGLTPTSSITYTVTVTQVGNVNCKTADTVDFLILQGFDIKNNDTAICNGDAVQIINAGSNLYNYSWTPVTGINNPNIVNPTITPTVNTLYTLIASHPGCPDSIQTINIDVEDIPVVNAGIDRIVCIPDTLHMGGSFTTSGSTNPNIYTILWKPMLGLNNASLLNATYSGTNTTNYTLTVTSPKGCKDSDIVAVQAVPSDFLILGPNKEMCPNDTVNLTASGAVNYLWQPGISVSDSLANNVQAFPISTQIYSVYATNIFGCKDTQTVKVYVANSGIINLGEDIILFPGETAQLNAIGNCSNFIWTPSFGLSNVNIPNPIANPNTTTQYVVMGSTEYGCPTSDTIIVTRLNESIINMPNAFTPGNGNHTNDFFHVDKNGIATLNYFRIFNRWGQMVFETSDILKGWDGNYNGAPQPLGTYVYTVDAQTNTGKRFTKSGNVTLIR